MIIVLAIIAYFFTGINSYGLGWKVYTAHFFSPFCDEMIVFIYSMLAVAIKNLVVRWNDKELAAIGKRAVQFKLASEKKASGM